MIIKLCYQNEIHRCSNPPKDFLGLQNLLAKTFRTELPQEFAICYTIPGEAENIPLSCQADYEALMAKNPASAVKILVKEKRENLREQEKMDMNVSSEKIQKEEEPRKDSNLESFVEILAEDMIVPKVQQYPYFSHSMVDDDQIRRIVKETLKDQLPNIISQVKEALLKELQASQPVMPVIEKIEMPAELLEVQRPPVVEKIEVPAELLEVQQPPVVEEIEVPREVLEAMDRIEMREPENIEQLVERVPEKRKESNQFVEKVKNFGKSLKANLFGLPGAAKNAIEDFSQKMEGDPLVQCEEGRYPKSVVDKAAELNEIFPEEQRKNLLDLVYRCPRHATLTQLADYYIRRGEPQQEEPEGVNENEENVAEEENEKEKEYAC